jgi:toxin YoeB
LEFDIAAFEDLAWWIEKDRAKAMRIVGLIKDIQRESVARTAQTRTHRLLVATNRPGHRIVYQGSKDKIRILACRYHY